jgi:hypothetical protein
MGSGALGTSTIDGLIPGRGADVAVAADTNADGRTNVLRMSGVKTVLFMRIDLLEHCRGRRGGAEYPGEKQTNAVEHQIGAISYLAPLPTLPRIEATEAGIQEAWP